MLRNEASIGKRSFTTFRMTKEYHILLQHYILRYPETSPGLLNT
ncbi:hypothetical protein [Mucilaginibacter limnophilus]|nr:hypothetical protein [Mucilaginibacter limnophilus]